MGKSKKKKKTTLKQQKGGYKKFVSDLLSTVRLMKLDTGLFELSPQQLRTCYNRRFRLSKLKRGNDNVSPRAYRFFTKVIQCYYRTGKMDMEGCQLTLYQVGLLISLFSSTYQFKFIKGKENENILELYNEISYLLLKALMDKFTTRCYFWMLMSNDPTRKYFSIKVELKEVLDEHPRLEVEFTLSAYPVREVAYKINGNRRPAYQLGVTSAEGMKWLMVKADKLKGYYTGEKSEIPVFIQSHALYRLLHRLDLFSNLTLNFQLYANLYPELNITFYRGFVLIPFQICKIKVGYLVGSIIRETLLIRTFLFITNSSTPEGDKLRALTGMSKDDFTWWRMDRISTFYGLKDGEADRLKELLMKAGLDDLLLIKNLEMERPLCNNNSNLEGLIQFLEQA